MSLVKSILTIAITIILVYVAIRVIGWIANITFGMSHNIISIVIVAVVALVVYRFVRGRLTGRSRRDMLD